MSLVEKPVFITQFMVHVNFNLFLFYFSPLSGVELKYNLSADVKHKEALPSRFYFHANGTSNVTAGSVSAEHGHTACRKHQAFMRVRGHSI